MIPPYTGATKTTHKLVEAAEAGVDVEAGLATAAPTKAAGFSASKDPDHTKLFLTYSV
jgi:hypothetical protein